MARHAADFPDTQDIIDVEITALNGDGDGIAPYGRGHLLVPFTLPGERVRVTRPRAARAARRPHPQHRSARSTRTDAGEPEAAAHARLVAVVRASPHRVDPPCPHFGPAPHRTGSQSGAGLHRGCGGCTWQHIAYPEQLRLKTARVDAVVRAALRNAPATTPMRPTTPIDAPWGYRHKVHFVFGHPAGGRGPLTMGHYARGSRRIVPVDTCPVHAEAGNDVAFALYASLARAGVGAAGGAAPAHNRARDGRDDGTLKSVAVRVAHGTPEIMTTLVVATDRDKRLRTATRAVFDDAPDHVGVHVNIHPRPDAYIFGRDTRHVRGPARLREAIGDVSYLVSPTAFFQTNLGAAEILVALVREAIPAGARVVDLYAGAGLFALPLAAAGHRVIAVEENRAATEDGEASRRLNGIPAERCQFIARPVEAALPRLPRTDSAVEAVVLDPPRTGCTPGVLQAVFGERRPDVAVYVSCDPDALGRDLTIIERLGYAARSVQPVDMFPHTPHVETVVVLVPQAAPRPFR